MPSPNTQAANAASVTGSTTITMRVGRGRESHQRTTLMEVTVGRSALFTSDILSGVSIYSDTDLTILVHHTKARLTVTSRRRRVRRMRHVRRSSGFR